MYKARYGSVLSVGSFSLSELGGRDVKLDEPNQRNFSRAAKAARLCATLFLGSPLNYQFHQSYRGTAHTQSIAWSVWFVGRGGGCSWLLGPIELQEVMRRRRWGQGRGSPCCRVGLRVNGGRLLLCHALHDGRQHASSGLAAPSLVDTSKCNTLYAD